MSDNAVLKSALRDKGYSLTAPRAAVFAALQSGEPLTMAELLARTGDSTDRASVYRIVGLFEQLGIVTRLQIGWKYRLELGDQFRPHHHHLYCTACGTYTELPEDAALEHQLLALAKAKHFTPRDHQIEIKGVCRTCAAQAT